MKRNILYYSAFAALLISSGCATYEEPPVATTKTTYTKLKSDETSKLPKDIKLLTLEQAQNLAISNNPGFKAKYFAIASARAKYYQTFSMYLPTANANFSMGQSFSSYRNGNSDRSQNEFYTPGISGSLLVFDSLQREMKILAAKHNWSYNAALEDDARRLLVRAVAYAYNDVMLASAQMKIAIADMKYNADLLKDTQLKFEAGAVPLSDVLNFKIRYNNGESTLFSAQYSYATNKYILAGLLGLTEGNIPDDVKFPNMPSADADILSDITVYLDTAVANRPDLRSYREYLAYAKYNYWASIAAFGPALTANYSLTYNQGHQITHPHSSGADNTGTGTVSYGLNASWNLFNGGNDYFNARSAQALMVQAKYSLAEQWISVITDVRTAYDNYITNMKQAKLYRKTFDLTKQTRDLVEEEYKAGSAELTRLNEAQRDLIEAENNLASSVIKMSKAKAQLEAAVNLK